MSGQELRGRNVLITGAGAGLGRAAAVRFAEAGATVSCADLDLQAARTTVELVHERGGNALPLHVDVADEASAHAMASAAIAHFGTIDVLLANAGIAGPGTAETTELDQWRRVMDVNVTGSWLTARAVIPVMRRQQRGVILLQSSIAALVGIPGGASYAASKGAVLALARQMNADLIGHGIRVNAICPGTVSTDLVVNMAQAKALTNGTTTALELEKLASRYPIGRLGDPQEIADAAVFLASDRASFVAGTGFVVDGGMTSV